MAEKIKTMSPEIKERQRRGYNRFDEPASPQIDQARRL